MRHPYALEVCEQSSHSIRLRVSGEIDLATAPSLLDSVLCAGLAYDAGHRILVDLAQVSFIDSSGLAALVEAHRWLANQEQVMVVVELPDYVVRLLELTGLDQVLRVERSSVDSTSVD